MENEMLALYNRCFPQYRTTEECFVRLLEPSGAHIIEARDADKLIGFAMLHGNSIALLCVDAVYRAKGYGASLLCQSEAFIRESGAKDIILGRGRRYLLQGVPVDAHNSAVSFFQKHGYRAAWESANMRLSLAAFDKAALTIPTPRETIDYRFAGEMDRSALRKAVADAHPSWGHIFESCVDPVMLAMSNGKIVGFQILSPNGAHFLPNEKVGSIGCVGVVHEYRKRGIGSRMVAEGADWLKQNGCASIELRYVAIVAWYEKMGFSVAGWQWMGEKRFKDD